MKNIVITLFTAMAFYCSGFCQQGDNMNENESAGQHAKKLASELLIFDTHMDVPLRLLWEKDVDLGSLTNTGHFDYVRAKKGGLDAAFMAVYISPSYEEKGGAKKLTDSVISLINKTINANPDKFAAALSTADIRKNFSAGQVSLPIGIENGTALEGNLDNLKHYYEAGVRYITLCHMKNNHICDSSGEPDKKWSGLSPFGKDLIKMMNDLGMMIDVSHISDDAFYQVLDLSRVPVIASHSGCRSLTPGFERNMSDEMIKALADKGGVIQINFGSSLMDNNVRLNYEKRSESIRAYLKENDLKYSDEQAKAFIEKYDLENPIGNSTLKVIADHIDHAVKLAGVEHVGLGSDFDGVEMTPEGLEDVSKYPALLEELLKRGYSDDDIKKICGENTMRVWSAVEKGKK